jgi:hypothetical protein
MKFFKVLFLSCFGAMLFSCDENTTEPGDSSQLMPLESGNYFYYDNTFYSSTGEVEEKVRDTTIVSGFNMIIENEQWNGVQRYFYNPSTRLIEMNFYRNKSNGLWTRRDMDAKSKHVAKYPAVTGERFVVSRDTLHLGIKETFRKVISANTSLTVPAGTFNVYKYQDESDGSTTVLKTEYYAPGRGLIKSETHTPDGILLRVRELAEFGKK